jgi:dTMP kinase
MAGPMNSHRDSKDDFKTIELSPLSDRGPFIAFEGLDGAGSSTQCRLFAERLRLFDQPVVETAEPSTGIVGAIIRQALQHRIWLAEESLALAFAADRIDHLLQPEHGVVQHLAQRRWVVSDRYVMSSLVYQSAAGLDLDWIQSVNRYAIAPDITVFIDSSIDDCINRISSRLDPSERYEEQESLARALAVYREQLAQKSADSVVIVSGNKDSTEVHESVWNSTTMAKLRADRGVG